MSGIQNIKITDQDIEDFHITLKTGLYMMSQLKNYISYIPLIVETPKGRDIIYGLPDQEKEMLAKFMNKFFVEENKKKVKSENLKHQIIKDNLSNKPTEQPEPDDQEDIEYEEKNETEERHKSP